MQRNYFGLTLTVLALAGCGVKFGSDGGSSDSDSFGATTGVVVTEGGGASDTGQPDPSGDVPPDGTTEAGPVETTDPTSETQGGVTSDTVTTEVPPDGTTGVVEPSVCELMCAQAVDCELSSDAVACVALCEDKFEGDNQVCEDATATMLACFAGLSCEHLALALDGEFGHPCNVELHDTQIACGPPSCDYGAGGDFEGTSCFIEILCDPVQRMECDTELCVCLVDGEQVGSCPAEDVCKDLNSQDDKAVACCGFPQVEL